METTYSSETSIDFRRTKPRYITEDNSSFHALVYENALPIIV
jgi:hypothetical protein